MAAPHNPARYGEMWPAALVRAQETELEALADLVVVSGGLAWHFMSSEGHAEYKHAHDHKDVDLFVERQDVASLIGRLLERGYERLPTRLDTPTFRRYVKAVEPDMEMVLDVFTDSPSWVSARRGVRVVDPRTLVGYYKASLHQSDRCFAYQNACQLLEQGQDPNGNPQLEDYSRWLDASPSASRSNRKRA